MSNQTLPEASKKAKEAPARKTQPARPTRGRLYRRQTARVEERRDGKPLIFGWGKRLSRRQKTKIQKRAFWAFIVVAALAVVSVLGYSLYYNNYAIPGEPVVTVNGQQIPQSLFRKLNFYLSQDVSNQLAAVQVQVNAAQKLASSSNQATQIEGEKELNDLQTQQQTLNAQFSIPTVGAQSEEDLVDDVLIQEQIPQLEARGVPASQLEASAQDITAKLNAFKKAFPATVTYSQFLSAAKMSEDDFRQVLAIVVRRDKMDKYQQSLFGPTGPQVHAWLFQTDTQQNADKYLAQIKSAPNVQDMFEKLAKRYSRDANTKTSGGDMGWVVYGDTSTGALAENWLFDAARKPGDLSGVIKIVNGEYNIYYISGIDPHRPISADKLSSLKSSALDHWVAQIKTLPQTHIGDVDSSRQLDPNNFPPNLPTGAASGASGAPTGP